MAKSPEQATRNGYLTMLGIILALSFFCVLMPVVSYADEHNMSLGQLTTRTMSNNDRFLAVFGMNFLTYSIIVFVAFAFLVALARYVRRPS